MSRSCASCWYVRPPRPALDFGPGATFPATCLVHDSLTRRQACAAWEEARAGSPAPTAFDVQVARAMFRAGERVRA